METFWCLLFLMGLLLIALHFTMKHFRGEGGCCGGGGYRPKRKKLKKVIEKKTFLVEGMRCQNCADRVMEAVNDLPHVSAQVWLKTGEVVVSYEQEVSEEAIRSQIERLGYRVRS